MRRRPGTLALSVLLLAVACKKDASNAVAPPPPSAPASAAAPAAPASAAAPAAPASAAAPAARTAAPTPAVPATPGPAYFAVDGAGLVRLWKGKFEKILDQPRSIRQVVAGREGRLWVNDFGGVYRVDGGNVEKIGDFRAPGSVDRIAVAPDGSLWCVSFKGVARYDGQRWTLQEKAKLGPDATLLKDVAVDSRGRVWVASSNALHVRENDGWRRVDTQSAEKLFFERLAVGPSGTVYALHSRAVLKLVGDQWREVILGPRVYSARELALGPREQIHVWAYQTLHVAPPDEVARQYSTRQLGVAATMVYAFAADQAGRSWVATDHGVVVIDGSGRAVQWRPGTVPELAGTVKAILVVGGGPELPAVGPQQTGSVAGKVVRGGEPVGGIPIEICASPSMFFRKSPCNDAPFKLRATTAADGTFRFDGVPLGTYRFGLKAGPKWTVTLSPCCAGMKAGKVFDIGALTLTQ